MFNMKSDIFVQFQIWSPYHIEIEKKYYIWTKAEPGITKSIKKIPMFMPYILFPLSVLILKSGKYD